MLGRAGNGRVDKMMSLWAGQMSFGYTITSGSIRFTVRRCKYTQVVVSGHTHRWVPNENEAAGRSTQAYEVEYSKR